MELGVAAGNYAVALRRSCPAGTVYIGVDKWDDHHDLTEMKQARARIEKAWGKHNYALHHTTFERYLTKCIQLGFTYNMVYIDGYAHTGQDEGRTIDLAWQVVGSGGILAGHDYDPRWPKTVQQVDTFVARHGLQGQLRLTHQDKYPSWILRR